MRWRQFWREFFFGKPLPPEIVYVDEHVMVVAPQGEARLDDLPPVLFRQPEPVDGGRARRASPRIG